VSENAISLYYSITLVNVKAILHSTVIIKIIFHPHRSLAADPYSMDVTHPKMLTHLTHDPLTHFCFGVLNFWSCNQVDSGNASAVNMSLFRNKAELYNKGRKIQNHGEIRTTLYTQTKQHEIHKFICITYSTGPQISCECCQSLSQSV